MLNFLIPLHPKLVHFPIALFFTALIFELLSRLFKKSFISEAAVLIYCFGAFLTPLVVYSGLWEQVRLHLNHPLLTQHKTFALLTMWISWVSLVFIWWINKHQSKYFRNFFLIILIIVNVTVTVTGYYGGKMVYAYGVGITQ